VADTLDPKHIDKRTYERYLRSGQLDEKAYEKHVKGLPDVADKALTVETSMLDEDFDDELDEDVDDEEADESDEDAETA
jgi:hypothetical protein